MPGNGLKITIIINNKLNQRIRKYIFDTWPNSQYGKLKAVTEEAIDEFLSKRDY